MLPILITILLLVLPIVAIGSIAPFCVAGLGAFLAETMYCSLPLRVFHGGKTPPLLLFSSSKADRRDGIVVIFCGAGGPDLNTDRLAAAVRSNDRRMRIRRLVHVCDWKPYGSSLIRAARNAAEIGEMLGKMVAEDSALHPSPTFYIHSIGISVGAFGADSLIGAVSKRLPARDGLSLRLSLLDPFTSKGVLRVLARLPQPLGRTATYCEQFMNTDDHVPSTNAPLKHAVCYDVTSSGGKRDYSPLPSDSPGHAFPVYYYARNLRRYIPDIGALAERHDGGAKRRGAVHVVE